MRPKANASEESADFEINHSPPAGVGPSHRDLRIGLLILLLCLLVYNANLRAIATGDTYPTGHPRHMHGC